jgi:hypothetical protein
VYQLNTKVDQLRFDIILWEVLKKIGKYIDLSRNPKIQVFTALEIIHVFVNSALQILRNRCSKPEVQLLQFNLEFWGLSR